MKVSAVSWGEFNPEGNKALPSGIEPRESCLVQQGDFLISRANTSELVGRSVIVKSRQVRLMISDKIVRCKFSSHIDQNFINYFNSSVVARDHYMKNASGTSDSMKNISREVISSVPVPLPLLAEQKRIVAKVDQLMALCDDLEAKLRRAEEGAQKLAEAMVAEIVT